MALDKTSLKNRIILELSAQGFNPNNSPWIEKFAQAIANAVIDEIQSNAVATGTDSGGNSHSLSIL